MAIMEPMDMENILQGLSRQIEDLEQENERIRSLVRQLRPYLEIDVESGLSVGPGTEQHYHEHYTNDNCPDCEWYEESVAWTKRIEAGELDV